MAVEASGASVTQSAPIAAPVEAATSSVEASHGHKVGFWALALGSFGVVFGDIGTSPLYAFKAAMDEALHDSASRPGILGVVSMALWALILVVTIKYVLFLMRADNRGEGGVLSLMALAQTALGRRTPLIFALGVIGAALFYGDAVITPAMSVLSAIEGMKTVPQLHGVVKNGTVMISAIAVLLVLFIAQARGPAKVATLFGPVMV